MQTDYRLDFPAIPVGQQQRINLLVRVTGGASVQRSTRLPLNLSVVLDRSGSMAGEKLDYVKKSANFLVQHLSRNDRFSLVTYNHDVTVNVQAQEVSDKERISAAIEQLTAGGTTNLSGGWLQGCQLVASHIQPQQVNRVLLLTDGLANQGITDAKRLQDMARQKRDEKITTTTMGVGLDFNEDLLTHIASEGGGAFYFIDNPDRAPHIFAEELRDLLSVVSQNLVVAFEPSHDFVTATQLNTYAIEQIESVTHYRLGDVYSEEDKVLLLQLTIAPQSERGQVTLGKLKIEYDAIATSSTIHQTMEYIINVAVVSPEDFAAQTGDEGVIKPALLLEAARARALAIQLADRGEYEEANKVLSKAADDIHDSQLEDADLLSEHNMLREEAVDMSLGARRYDSHSRKSSTSKVFNSTQRLRRDETVMIHRRMRAARQALERHGPTPRIIKWKREQLTLDMAELKIGRSTDNDIVVPENEVSEHHCSITKRGDDYILEDRGSTNGTFANGGQINGAFRLSVGDVVTVGTWLFMFER